MPAALGLRSGDALWLGSGLTLVFSGQAEEVRPGLETK